MCAGGLGQAAWRIPWTEEPDRLQSIGSRRIGYDWATEYSCMHAVPRYRTSLPTPSGEDKQHSLSPWEALYSYTLNICKSIKTYINGIVLFILAFSEERMASIDFLLLLPLFSPPPSCVFPTTASLLHPSPCTHRTLQINKLVSSLLLLFTFHFVFSLTTELLKLLLNVLKGTIYWKVFLTTT